MQPGGDVDGAAGPTRLHAWFIRRVVTLWGTNKTHTMVNLATNTCQVLFLQLATTLYLEYLETVFLSVKYEAFKWQG